MNKTILSLQAGDVSTRPPPSVPDDENIRLLTGFNDIFVTLALILVLTAVAWFGRRVSVLGGGAAVVAAAWGLSEYFTRRRRMALPSIVLFLAFIFGIGAIASGMFAILNAHAALTRPVIIIAAFNAFGSGAAFAHWRRFRVAITIAFAALLGLATPVLLLFAAVPATVQWLNSLLLVGGLAMFAFAMRWDSSDRLRQTSRSDVAFWLHLLAAPMIVHPIFRWLGLSPGLLFGRAPTAQAFGQLTPALLAVLIYLLLGLIAVIIDRRAVLVSGLAYVICAVAVVIRHAGSLDASLALTALLVGALLLMLSVFWRPIRRVVLRAMPLPLQEKVPPAAAT